VLRAAIVGLGWWGRHIAACLSQPGAKLNLVRGVDPQAEELTEIGERYAIPVTAKLEDALAAPEVDVVIIATPHSLHEAQILACASAGKHVFCEKPLALTAVSARRAIDFRRGSNVPQVRKRFRAGRRLRGMPRRPA